MYYIYDNTIYVCRSFGCGRWIFQKMTLMTFHLLSALLTFFKEGGCQENHNICDVRVHCNFILTLFCNF